MDWHPETIGLEPTTDQKIVELCGDAINGHMGTSVRPFYTSDVPGMKKLKEITRNYLPNYPDLKFTLHYTWGWLIADVFTEAFKKAGKNLTRQKVIDALETFRNYDTGGLMPPITFTPTDHVASRSCKVYKMEAKNPMIWVPLTGFREPRTK